MTATVVKMPVRPRPVRADQEFLPAALEILETPPSPVRLALLLIICTLATAALAWSYFGRIDIVAIAQGKIQPTGRVKVIQPLETGKVASILVENGKHVSAGQTLLELDATEVKAEEAALSANLSALKAEIVRRGAAIEAASHEKLTHRALTWDGAIPPLVRRREERVLAGDLAQLSATLASLAAQEHQKETERDRLTGTSKVQRELIATLQERVSMRATLVEKNAGTKAGLIDATETLQYQQAALATQVGQLAEAEAGLVVIARDIAKARDTFVADNGQKLAEAERQADDMEQKLAKAQARSDHMTLRSPLDGIVQGLSVTTIGQVATIGEELMRIVPDGSGLEIEAYLPNKDIGFVRTDQDAMIKIESFPFTRYGILSGQVVRVASDAIPEPDAQQMEGSPAKASKSTGFAGGAQRTQNLVFPVTIRPEALSVEADGKTIPLSPGMAVSVEIKTGRRRILEYIFSPLVEVGSEALRER